MAEYCTRLYLLELESQTFDLAREQGSRMENYLESESEEET